MRGRFGKKLSDLLPGRGNDCRGSVIEPLDLLLWRDGAGKAFSGHTDQPDNNDSEESVDAHLVPPGLAHERWISIPGSSPADCDKAHNAQYGHPVSRTGDTLKRVSE